MTDTASGACFNKHDGLSDPATDDSIWTNSMERWSVARSDSSACLLKQVPGNPVGNPSFVHGSCAKFATDTSGQDTRNPRAVTPGPYSPCTTFLEYSDLFCPRVLTRALTRLVRHSWNTVDLFCPWVLTRLVRHSWNTVDLFCPWVLTRHAWNTVDLTFLEYSGPILSSGPYYSPCTTFLEYSGPILFPVLIIPPVRHAWNTVDLFCPRVLIIPPVRHAWNTVDLFCPGVLIIPPVRHAWNTVDLFCPRVLIIPPVRHAWNTVDDMPGPPGLGNKNTNHYSC